MSGGFNLRLAGPNLGKTMKIEDGGTFVMGPKFAYVETKGVVTKGGSDGGISFVKPDIDITPKSRLFVQYNPKLGRNGYVLCQTILEVGDAIIAIIPEGDVDLDGLDWVFRIYAARE